VVSGDVLHDYASVLAFASFAVFIISSFWHCAGSRAIGDNGSAVGALGIRFALDDNPAWLVPRTGQVVEAGEEALWLACLKS
jgi:hypothetical protein